MILNKNQDFLSLAKCPKKKQKELKIKHVWDYHPLQLISLLVRYDRHSIIVMDLVTATQALS